jgi:MtN3 and saliva related transmembrane protein
LPPAIELIGILAGIITTFGWVPQLIKIARERKAGDISLPTTASLAAGVSLWVVYGLFIGSWPVILANGVTFLFVASILGMKLRFG